MSKAAHVAVLAHVRPDNIARTVDQGSATSRRAITTTVACGNAYRLPIAVGRASLGGVGATPTTARDAALTLTTGIVWIAVRAGDESNDDYQAPYT